MENSELQKQVINLGKLFVKELDLDPGVDTLSRWMAHYIAEKMIVAEKSTGSKKIAAEKECFDTILKLWEHRWNLPQGKRPFEGYDLILQTITKISADNNDSYPLFEIIGRNFNQRNSIDEHPLEGSTWVEAAKKIDKVARILIEYALAEAARETKKDTTDEWLNTTANFPDNNDITAIRIVLNLAESEDEKIEAEKSLKIQRIQKKISELKQFHHLSELIIQNYSKKITEMENS